MDWNQDFYQAASRLPAEQIEQYLRKILPPAKLALLMDGTLFRFTERGAGLFRVQTALAEAGIPPDDPRARMFNRLSGWLIDPSIPARLHAIAQKQETLMGSLGAVSSFDVHGRRAWWVPLNVTTAFEQVYLDWFRAFAAARDHLLVAPYPQVVRESRERVLRSAEAAWDDLQRLGKAEGTRMAYLQAAEAIFARRFPAREALPEKITLALVPCQAPLPPDLERIYRKLQNKAREKEAAELEATRMRTKREAVQLELLEMERQFKQAEGDRLNEAQAARERLIREAVQPEVEQARQIVLQVQARVIRLCQSILARVQQGASISPATRRSWNKAFRELSLLAPDHPQLMEALQTMQGIAKESHPPDAREIAAASHQIGEALSNLERRAAVNLDAEALWQLLQAGQAEEALRRLQGLRGQLTNRLEEVESLYELMTALGTQENDREEMPEAIPIAVMSKV